MEKLLRWSVDAQNDPANAGEPDPQLLAQLFGTGDDDLTNMKLALRTAVEAENVDDRIDALEVFEELIENIDNADNMGRLWEPLLYLVNDRDARIRALAVSTVGSVVQNNPKGQKDLLATGSGLGTVMEHMADADEAVAAKTMYALASALGHNPDMYAEFAAQGGWAALAHLYAGAGAGAALTRPQARGLTLLLALALLADRAPVLGALRDTPVVPALVKVYPETTPANREKLDHFFDALQSAGYDFERPPVIHAEHHA